jgi:hypothetical protein
MVLLVWPPAEHLWIGRNRGQFVPYSDAARWLRTLAEDPGSARPELHIQMPQLKREQSLWPYFGWIPANLRDLSKG